MELQNLAPRLCQLSQLFCDRPLVAQLEAEAHDSQLPDESGCRDALNDLLVRIRLQNVGL